MLLQNLHCRYLYIVIQLPHLKDLDQKIPSIPNCDNYGIHRASNPNPLNDNTRTNDNELHQQLCRTFEIDYFQEMDIITKVKSRLECKINVTLLVLLPNKMTGDSRGLVTSSDKTAQDKSHSRNKRAILLLAIAQGTAAIGSMLIRGINALVDAKRANSFYNTIKMLNANVEITHNRLVTLENITSMMAKVIMPVLKDLKLQINKTNEQLASQYRMMSSAHNRYNLLFRQMHEMQMIHHFALLLFKNYLTIQVGTLQRIHRQYIRYGSALDDTLIGIENLSSRYLTHHILDPQVLTKYLKIIEDDLEEMAPEYEPVFTSVCQYYGNSLASFTNTIDDLLLQLPILIKLKVHILNRLELCECSLTAGNYLLSQTDTNCGDMPEARDGYFTTYYAFNKIILDVITVKFNIQVDERTTTQSTLLHDDILGYNLPVNDDEDLILKEENLEIYVHLENILIHMIDAQDVAIFKSQKDYVRNKQKLSEYICYAQMWQVLSVIFSYAAFTCDIILVITLIAFFIRYQKIMQAMLTAFITMNTSNSGIPFAKANSISRTFPPLFMIKIPEEEQIVKDLQEIESMQLVVQVIMVIVCIIIAFIVLYYCCKNFRHMRTLFKYCFLFLPILRILRTSCTTDLFIEVTNVMKGNTVWAHITA